MYVERRIIRFNERTKILTVHWHGTRAPRQHWMSITSLTQRIATHTSHQLWKTNTKANACHRKPSWGLWTHKQTQQHTACCQTLMVITEHFFAKFRSSSAEEKIAQVSLNQICSSGGFPIIMASGHPNHPNPTSSMFDGFSWRLSGTCKALTTFCNLQDWWWLNGYHHQGWVKGHQVNMTCNVV